MTVVLFDRQANKRERLSWCGGSEFLKNGGILINAADINSMLAGCRKKGDELLIAIPNSHFFSFT